MTRVGVLRLGYAAFALAFVCLAASPWLGALLATGLAAALIGAVLLIFSGDDLPKWAGVTILVYILVLVLVFLLATSLTIQGSEFYYESPAPDLADALFQYFALAIPLILAGAVLAAAWERELPARYLLIGSIAGYVILAIITITTQPAGDTPEAIAAAKAQGDLLENLFAISALASAAGAGWAAARVEESA